MLAKIAETKKRTKQGKLLIMPKTNIIIQALKCMNEFVLESLHLKYSVLRQN